MRVNVYAEEMPDNIEQGVVLFEKTVEGGGTFTALRFYLHLPVTQDDNSGAPPGVTVQHKGPFLHHPGDDDSSAVTFWGKKDMRPMLRRALALLDAHEEERRFGQPHYGHPSDRPLNAPSGPAAAPTVTAPMVQVGGDVALTVENNSAPATEYIAPKMDEAIDRSVSLMGNSNGRLSPTG